MDIPELAPQLLLPALQGSDAFMGGHIEGAHELIYHALTVMLECHQGVDQMSISILILFGKDDVVVGLFAAIHPHIINLSQAFDLFTLSSAADDLLRQTFQG